jgi:hypothetical protein
MKLMKILVLQRKSIKRIMFGNSAAFGLRSMGRRKLRIEPDTSVSSL